MHAVRLLWLVALLTLLCLGCVADTAPPVRVLNNFVSELLNLPLPDGTAHAFTNPREGFLFVQVQPADTAGDQAPIVRIDFRPVVLRQVGGNFEGMLRRPAGACHIRVSGPSPARLIVRAVGELTYMKYYGSGPWLTTTETYTWEWLRANALDSYNVVVGQDNPATQDAEIREWTSEGKWWTTPSGLPWEAQSAEEAYQFFAQQPGMSGLWGDEFLPKGPKIDARIYPLFTEAVRKLKANPQFQGHRLYAYVTSRPSPDMYDFVRAIVESDYRLCWEWYNLERRTQEELPSLFRADVEMNNRHAWEVAQTEAGNDRIVVLAVYSQPPLSFDIYPQANFDVFLDLQMQFLATTPAFAGTRGLQSYYSPYASEEVTRLLARLLRHYALEGHTDRLLTDPYMLTELENGDFVEGTQGWTLQPAAPDSISAQTAPGFGGLQGRWRSLKTGVGDTALLTRRSAAGPNVFSQQLRNLQPGRVYSLRFITGNYQDLLNGKSHFYQHALSVRVEGAQLLPEKSFDALSFQHPDLTFGSFNRGNLYRTNYHQRLFRAQGETAQLVFSDWASAQEPGGPEGEELLWNFIQVQPYFEG
jgi:hypothetical protein